MFPPSLYDYVTNTLKKGFILVLNKIDLASASLVVAWKHYFQEKYPNLQIVMFTTLPGYNLIGKHSDVRGGNHKIKLNIPICYLQYLKRYDYTVCRKSFKSLVSTRGGITSILQFFKESTKRKFIFI